MKLYKVYFFISILLFSAVSVNAIRDTTSPVFNSLFFSVPSGTGGDKIDIVVDATDDLSGIQSIEYGFAGPSGIIFYRFMSYNLTYNMWSDTVEISQYWVNGLYFVDSITIIDDFNNVRLVEDDVSWNSDRIDITGNTLGDPFSPSLYLMEFDRTTASPGETFLIRADVFDADSGVSDVFVEFYTGTYGSFDYYEFVELFFNDVTMLWEANLTVNQYWPMQLYHIGNVIISDFAGNSDTIFGASNNLNILGTIWDTTPPADPFWTIFFERISVPQNESVKLFVNPTDSQSGIASVRAVITAEDDRSHIIRDIEMVLNTTSGYWEASFELSEYWEGMYVLDKMYIYDVIGNMYTYSDLNDGIYTFCAYNPDVDTDGDQMPDDWEICYFFNPADPSDWNAASDEDGLDPREEFFIGSNPRDTDSDNDNMGDWQEVKYLSTSPIYYDSNMDGVPDGDEDEDQDGLTNIYEFTNNLLPNDTDTDNDCLSDGFEVQWSGAPISANPLVWTASNGDYDGDGLNLMDEGFADTNPTLVDSDGDGLDDYEEVMMYRTDPNEVDSDFDLLDDYLEVITLGSNPWSNDTDSDMLSDKYEYDFSQGYLNETGYAKTGYISMFLPDSDGDLLSDYDEIMFVGSYPFLNDSDYDGIFDYDEYLIYGSSPMLVDTDSDDLSDNFEVYVSKSDPTLIDTDFDGLNDSMEVFHHTNLRLNDTDSDGISDGDEIFVNYSNPLIIDTDDDGLDDFIEMNYGSNSTNNDTDGDLMPDFWEYGFNLNLNFDDSGIDIDNDNLTSLFEYYNSTHPMNADPDSDGLNDYYELLNGTDPWKWDTDLDLLSDGDEVFIHHTSPLLVDTDGDGLEDYAEIFIHSSDPLMYDSDFDNLSDYDEIITFKTNHESNDTDSDGLNDFDELFNLNSNPLLNDTDGDGINDYDEVHVYFTSVNNPDTDDDGLNDGDELIYLTDLFRQDTDEDGLFDGDEIKFGADPLLNDSDADSLSDGYEVHTLNSNPTNNDTDGDTLPDYWEAMYNLKILVDDTNEDPDNDLVVNLGEYLLGTDPTRADTDNDGYDDGFEVEKDTDPLDPDSTPNLGDEIVEGITQQPLLTSGAILALIISMVLGVRSFGGKP